MYMNFYLLKVSRSRNKIDKIDKIKGQIYSLKTCISDLKIYGLQENEKANTAGTAAATVNAATAAVNHNAAQ